MKVSPTPFILSNESCQVCGKRSDIVCNECLYLNLLACYCKRHTWHHKLQMFGHEPLWGELGK